MPFGSRGASPDGGSACPREAWPKSFVEGLGSGRASRSSCPTTATRAIVQIRRLVPDPADALAILRTLLRKPVRAEYALEDMARRRTASTRFGTRRVHVAGSDGWMIGRSACACPNRAATLTVMSSAAATAHGVGSCARC